MFLTDGESEAASALAVKTGDLRLFALGIGDDVNRPLLQRLAAEKRGKFTFIADAQAIEPAVARLARSIARPLLVDVSVDVDGQTAARIYPRTLPDLFAEDELRVTGRLRGQGPVSFTVRGKLGGKPVAFHRTIDPARSGARAWTAPLWAQSRVEHLLEQIELDGASPELQDEVTTLALAYNFVTPYTAFLAVPESELGPAASTLAAARDRKRQILAQRQAQPAAPGVAKDVDAPGEVIAVQGAAPQMDQSTTTLGVTITEDFVKNVPTPGRTYDKAIASADGDDDAKAAVAPNTTAAPNHHGCAGCAAHGPGDRASLLALIAAVALVLRRRSRAAR